jgi:hypothetical protein
MVYTKDDEENKYAYHIYQLGKKETKKLQVQSPKFNQNQIKLTSNEFEIIKNIYFTIPFMIFLIQVLFLVFPQLLDNSLVNWIVHPGLFILSITSYTCIVILYERDSTFWKTSYLYALPFILAVMVLLKSRDDYVFTTSFGTFFAMVSIWYCIVLLIYTFHLINKLSVFS